MGSMLAWYVLNEKQNMEARQLKNMEIEIQLLAEAVSFPMSIRDFDSLQRICRQLHTIDADIRYIVLEGNNARIIFSAGAASHDKSMDMENMSRRKELPSGVSRLEVVHHGVDYELQYQVKLFNAAIGKLHFGVSMARIRSAIRDFVLMNLLVGIGAVIAGVVIFISVIRIGVTGPIKELRDISNEVSAGNLEARTQFTSRDEIGLLAENFNNMTARLRGLIAELKASESKYKTLLENLPQKVFLKDANSVFISCNKNFADDLKISPGEVPDKTDYDFFPDELAEKYRRDDRRVIESGNIEEFEEQYIQDGKEIIVHTVKTPVRDENGEVSGILGIFWDITDRIMAVNALKESEQAYRTLAENLPGIVYRLFLGKNRKMIFFNDMIEPMTGYSSGELKQGEICSFESMIPPEDRNDVISTVKRAIEEKKPFEIEYRLRHRTGNIKYFHERGRPVFEEDGEPLFIDGAIIDITEAKNSNIKQQELQAQLNQAQKMESIGAMAGGIAHDFNNILSAILGFSELALMNLEDRKQVEEYMGEVLKGAERARNLVKQILTFSRKTQQEKQPLQIAIIIKEALKLLRSSIPTTIEIRENIASRATILADPTQVHQIIMNLCTNAYHAMRETGGTLAVELKEIELADQDITPEFNIQPGKYLQLEVGDTGCGMTSEIKEKIFEPYFTTKEVGAGTGLGLAVVHGIVHDYNGCINVYSEVGCGTTIHLYFPVMEEEANSIGLEVDEGRLTGGDERIMVVDDEESIVKLVAISLKKHGYNVSTFTNGVPACQELEKNPDNYDLLITDMTMPFMTGAELSRKALETCPTLPIILCTGQSELINREKALAMGVKEYCNKPLNTKQLLLTVRKTLDAA